MNSWVTRRSRVVRLPCLKTKGWTTWFEYGIGANFNLGKNTYFWADLERTAGALVDEDIRGTLGVRFGFKNAI